MKKIKKITDKIETFLELGGVKKDVTMLVISGISLLLSIFRVFPRFPFDFAWISIILCGVPILLEAIILAITGILGPMLGALVHNCGSVFVIINSAVLLRWSMKD